MTEDTDFLFKDITDWSVLDVGAQAPYRYQDRELHRARADNCPATRQFLMDMQLPHAACAIQLSISVVGAPDCVVTIRAVDREQQTLIRNALVVMHPYRAVTDDDGVAKIRAARGQYDILVSGFRYLATSTSVEVKDDLFTVAELDVDQPWTSREEHLA
jgi:hypothetical protein